MMRVSFRMFTDFFYSVFSPFILRQKYSVSSSRHFKSNKIVGRIIRFSSRSISRPFSITVVRDSGTSLFFTYKTQPYRSSAAEV